MILLAGTQINPSQGEQESISQAQVISKSDAHDHDNFTQIKWLKYIDFEYSGGVIPSRSTQYMEAACKLNTKLTIHPFAFRQSFDDFDNACEDDDGNCDVDCGDVGDGASEKLKQNAQLTHCSISWCSCNANSHFLDFLYDHYTYLYGLFVNPICLGRTPMHLVELSLVGR